MPHTSGDGVTIITGDATRAAFAKGTPLIETAAYKVHASRREGPGTAEVHARDIDIFYILEGSATLVTGGRPIDAKTTAPDDVCAPSIEGGTSRAVAKGDVVIIHNGVPHWFKRSGARSSTNRRCRLRPACSHRSVARDAARRAGSDASQAWASHIDHDR